MLDVCTGALAAGRHPAADGLVCDTMGRERACWRRGWLIYIFSMIGMSVGVFRFAGLLSRMILKCLVHMDIGMSG